MRISEVDNLIVVDVETSGVNPFVHDVVSVALAPLNGDAPPLNIYVKSADISWTNYARLNFEKFRDVWEAESVSADIACRRIDGYLAGIYGERVVTPIGHNIGFDVAFLRKLAFAAGLDQLPRISHRALDTHTLLYLLYLEGRVPSSALSSDGAFEFFEISVKETERHTALGDMRATQALFKSIIEMLTCGTITE